jgi:hypothetical protein
VAVNTAPKDAKTDTQAGLPAPGLVQMRMAPTHHGLEGAEYSIVVAALSTSALSDAAAGVGLSSIYARVKDNKLEFNPAGDKPVDLTAERFPPFPEGARYNFVDQVQGALRGRSFRFSSAPGAGVSIVRVSFTDELEHTWDVLFDVAQGTNMVTVPSLPAGSTLRDRTFANGLKTGKRSSMLVQMFSLNTVPGGTTGANITFNNLVELNSTNGNRVTDFLKAFSLMTYSPPEVSFKAPGASPATIAKATKIVVKTSSFKLGQTNDGLVHLNFTTAGGAPVAGCDEARLSTEVTAGSGELEYTLPATCAGADITLKAQLFSGSGAAILPEVSKTTIVTIQ